MANRDYYEVLGIDRGSSLEDIKKVYRQLAMRYHPDRNPGSKESEEKFKEVTEAYEVLGDNEKRSRYDRFGHDGIRQGQDFHDFRNVNDIFSMFGDFFGGGINVNFRGGSISERGNDIKVRISLSYEEIYNGINKDVKYDRLEVCLHCNGNGSSDGSMSNCNQCGGGGRVKKVDSSPFGQVINIATCGVCRGTGKSIRNKCNYCLGNCNVKKYGYSFNVNIPKGISKNNFLKFSGQGDYGKFGGGYGDLILEIVELEHRIFTRSNNDVVLNLRVPIAMAMLGGRVKVPTLGGEVEVSIKTLSKVGDKIILNNMGFSDVNNGNRGNQIIVINYIYPIEIINKERVILEDLGNSINFSKDKINFNK